MINQQRIYDVNFDLEDRFLDRFRDHAHRIMTERRSFRILAMWLAREEERLRFVYLLSWTDAAEMRAKWSAFMADGEWERIKQESREPVKAAESIRLDLVSSSSPL